VDAAGYKQAAQAATVALLGLLLLAGCASVPNIDSVVDNAAGRPKMVGARGPLSAQASRDILAKLKAEAGDTDVMQRHLALEGALADAPISVGNDVQVLASGEAAFDAFFAAMTRAQSSINIEYFTVEDIEQKGQHLGDLLIEKVKAGVVVNVIYDSVGSAGTPGEFFTRLKDGGVRVVDFNPASPFKAKGKYKPNDRDHRKILVVDGKVAVIGGVNMSKVYASLPIHGEDRKTTPPVAWKDTDIKIEGPAVAELQKLYVATWKSQHGEDLDESRLFPPAQTRGNEIVHVMGSSPDSARVPPYYASLLSAVRNAEIRIWATIAYFVPTHAEMEDLIAAARRGVDVRLLMPGKSDSPLAAKVGHSRYTELLSNGVKIYETRDSMMHSKTVVVDGVWSVVGSSNIDHRSVIYNNEVDAVILGRETAGQLEASFQEEIAKANPVDLVEWKRRPLPQRFKEFFAKLWQNML
jgi:cardiolipin synthase